MNMITSAWIKKSRSIGIPVLSPMSAPPLRSAPKTSDVATTPLGRVPPTRAIAIAVKPTPPEIAVVSCFTVPTTSKAPPMPAIAPEMSMAITTDEAAPMPA